MGRRPVRDDGDILPAGERIGELQDERTLNAATAARDFLEQFQGNADARVVVLKRNPQNGKWEYIKTFAMDVVDEDFLRNNFGHGSYKMTVRGPKNDQFPSGHYGQHIMDIADIGTPASSAPPAPAPDNGADMLKAVLAMTMQRADSLEKMVFAMLANKGNGNDALDPTKVLDIGTRIAEKMSENKGAAFDPNTMLTQFLQWYDKGYERGMERDTPKDDDTGFGGIVRDIGKPLVEILSRGNPPQLPPAPVATTVVSSSPQRVEVPVHIGPPWLEALKPFLPTLLNLARANVSPELVADMIIEQMSDDVADKVHGDSIAPDWETQTMQHLPRIFREQFPTWTRTVLTALKDGLTDDGDTATIGENPEGDGEE